MVATAFEVRGAIARLHDEWMEHDEILVDGPAGTGKSMGVAWWLDKIACTYPGCRILVCRRTRVSLTQSWMVTFKKTMQMLFPGGQREHLFRGASDAHRQEYVYRNGSRIVLGGMDNPTRLFSTEYDIAYVNESNELSEHEFESLHRALRNGVIPHSVLIADCNPDSDDHWLYHRFQRGTTHRIQSRHRDNPFLTDTEQGRAYLHKLETQLTGTRYKRLYLGVWCAAEGQVYDMYSAQKHIVRGGLERAQNGTWRLLLTKGLGGTPEKPADVPLVRFFGSQDWGYTNPGCQLVWGMDQAGRMFLVREHYQTRRKIDWWAGVAEENYKQFKLNPIICDTAEPEYIDTFNDRLGVPGGRETARIAIPAEKAVQTGIDHVRDRLMDDEDGLPRIFFLESALAHQPDPTLSGEDVTSTVKRPTSTVREFPGYVYKDVEPDKEDKARDEPVKRNDHGMDAVRYACMWAWRRDPKPATHKIEYAPGTYGATLPGHRRRKRRRSA